VSAASRLSLNAEYSKFNYDNPLGSDYDSRSGFVRYEIRGARTAISADLGRTRTADRIASATGSLYSLGLTRKMSSAATFSLSAGQGLTDTAATLSPGPAGTPQPPSYAAQATLSDGGFFRRYGTAALDYKRDRNAFQMAAKVSRDKYVSRPDTVAKRQQWSASWSRLFSSRWTGRLSFMLVDSSYSLGSGDSDMRTTAELSYQMAQTLSAALSAQHGRRKVDGLAGSANENVIFLTFGKKLR
jgi:hypothetical protein